MLYPGLGDEGKQILEEFSALPNPEPNHTSDPGPPAEDEQSLGGLGQDGIAQGFIDDIQGLLNGKQVYFSVRVCAPC
jgi:hypothetical protein